MARGGGGGVEEARQPHPTHPPLSRFTYSHSTHDVAVISQRANGCTPATEFARLAGATALPPRFVPGTFTNQVITPRPSKPSHCIMHYRRDCFCHHCTIVLIIVFVIIIIISSSSSSSIISNHLHPSDHPPLRSPPPPHRYRPPR